MKYKISVLEVKDLIAKKRNQTNIKNDLRKLDLIEEYVLKGLEDYNFLEVTEDDLNFLGAE